MLFNVDKCKVMHIGFNNIKTKYEMSGKFLEEASEEHGVVIQRDLKCSSQAVNTANGSWVLGMIKRTFRVRDKKFIVQTKNIYIYIYII